MNLGFLKLISGGRSVVSASFLILLLSGTPQVVNAAGGSFGCWAFGWALQFFGQCSNDKTLVVLDTEPLPPPAPPAIPMPPPNVVIPPPSNSSVVIPATLPKPPQITTNDHGATTQIFNTNVIGVAEDDINNRIFALIEYINARAVNHTALTTQFADTQARLEMLENRPATTKRVGSGDRYNDTTLNGYTLFPSLSPDSLTYIDNAGKLTSAGALLFKDNSLIIGTTTPMEAMTLNGALYISSSSPRSTTNALYNLSGSLYWNGVELGSGTATGSPSSLNALTDVVLTSVVPGNVLSFNGTNWVNVATSALGIVGGSSSFTNSSELASLIDDETGTGRVVFSNAPTFAGTSTFDWFTTTGLTATGTANFATVNTSGPLSLMGSSANVALGSNFLSGDGDDEGIIVNSSGNVGIGTSTPEIPLDVVGRARFGRNSGVINQFATIIVGERAANDNIATIKLGTTGASYNIDTSGNNGTFQIFDNNSVATRFLITSNGNVGIGTSSPSARLTVQGDMRLTGRFADTASSTGLVGQILSATANGTAWTSTSSLGFRESNWLDNGTFLTPLTASDGLVLTGSSTAMALRISALRDSANSLGTVGQILQTNGATSQWVSTSSLGFSGAFTNSSQLATLLSDETGTGAAVFGLGATLSSTTLLGISYFNGDVGIGTSLPQSRLEIQNTGASTTLSLTPFNDLAKTQQISANNESLQFITKGPNTGGLIQFFSGAISRERLRIQGNGNVGIGTQSPSAKLTIMNDGDGSDILVNGTSSVNFGNASLGLFNGQNDSRWTFTAANSVAGGQPGLTFFDALYAQNPFFIETGALSNSLVIRGSGNIGIGTSSPSARLTVHGDMRLTGRLADSSSSTGSVGQLLMATASGTQWIATSTLGLGGGSSNWLDNGTFITPLTATDGLVLTGSSTAMALRISALRDSTNSLGTVGQILQTNGATSQWISTSTLGISLSDTTGTLAANRGGTGTSTIALNQLLIGGPGNTWTQVATSALGLASGFFAQGGNSFGEAALFGTNDNNVVNFETNGTINMTLATSGNLGIGTTSPVARLSIQASAGQDMLVIASSTGSTSLALLANGSLELPGQFVSAGINWTTQNVAGNNDGWQDITYGNGLFVAISDQNDRLVTSPDGINWTVRSVAGNDDLWEGVTYGNGLFVAVGASTDPVITSVDGITWTVQNAVGNNDNWSDVTYGNGLFVAVGSSGDRVMTSPDGINWTARPAAGSDDTWKDVTFGNGLFVAVANSATDKVMTSPNGITWTIRSAAGDDDGWQGVTYGAGLFVAVSAFNDRVMTSPNGTTWTARSAAGDNDQWYAVTYGNGMFVAVGAFLGDGVMTSPDGINWTPRTNNSVSGVSVAYGNGMFVHAGQSVVQTSGFKEVVSMHANNIHQGDSAFMSRLAVGTTSTSSSLFIQAQAGQRALVIASSSGDSLLTITSSGNLGLGTTSPSALLTVAGDMRLTGRFADSSSSTGALGNILTAAANGTVWVATSTLGLSPSFSNSLQLANLLSDETGAGFTVFNTNPSFAGLISTSTLTLSGTAANIALGSNYLSGDGQDEGIFVDSNGFVGIGTSTPSESLTVGGNALVAGNLSALGTISASGTATIGGTLTVSGTINSFGNIIVSSGIFAGGSVLSNFAAHTGLNSANSTSAGFTFGNATTSDVRVTMAGTNTTSTVLTANSNYSAFTVGRAPITESTSGVHNWINNATILPVGIITNGSATTNNSASLFVDGANTSGVATNNYIFYASSTLPFVIRDTGNVGIGTTTPAGILSVVGSIFATGSLYSGNGSSSAPAIASALDTNTGLYFTGNDSINIATNGLDRGTIDPGGLLNWFGTIRGVILSTANGSALLPSYNFTNDSDTGIFRPATNTIAFTTGGSERVTITSAGSVGIGTSSPSAELTTTGSVRFANFGAGTLTTDANGNLSVSSDERLKNIESDFTKGLAEVIQINPVSFTWKPETGFDTVNTYTGFSAQNIQLAIPEAVGVDKKGFLSLSDRPLLAAVINAVKELYAKITQNTTDIDALKAQNAALLERVNNLEEKVNGEVTNPSESSDSPTNTPTDGTPLDSPAPESSDVSLIPDTEDESDVTVADDAPEVPVATDGVSTIPE